MSFEKSEIVYEGKAKKIFQVTGDEDKFWLEFKDDLTAFNAEKKGSFSGKGVVNRDIATLIFKYLQTFQVPHHWIADMGDREMVVQKVEIIPLEVVVRNVLAGSTAKKFALEEGSPLESPLVEFFYKKDELGDPFVSDDQALMLKAASSQQQLNQLKAMALEINQYLIKLFEGAGIRLIDFKLEFGVTSEGKIILADEITPDSCRLWDKETNEKMDKDRFRRDLGNIAESYQAVFQRLKKSVKGRV